MQLTPEQGSAQNRIHDLLTELADLIGPNLDGRAEDHGDDPPTGHVFLSEWVMVAAWVDEAGKTSITRWGSPNMPGHHMLGLLHDGLFGFGD